MKKEAFEKERMEKDGRGQTKPPQAPGALQRNASHPIQRKVQGA
jgi:hypothetical protein